MAAESGAYRVDMKRILLKILAGVAIIGLLFCFVSIIVFAINGISIISPIFGIVAFSILLYISIKTLRKIPK